MSHHLHRDIEALEEDLLAMSAEVERMIELACRSLRERQPDLAREAISQDVTVDRHEVGIEEECLKILALHQPVAIDLRRTAAVLKINGDLERIADLACNIAERAIPLAQHSDFEIPNKLDRMTTLAVNMVRTSLDSFVKSDVDQARETCQRDNEVDRLNVEVIDELRRAMHADELAIEPALHCFSVSRHIERIADHATNIAEDVIYLVEGEIARHHFDQPNREQLTCGN